MVADLALMDESSGTGYGWRYQTQRSRRRAKSQSASLGVSVLIRLMVTATAMVASLSATQTYAASVQVDFSRLGGVVGPAGSSTSVFRADLSGVPFSELLSITLQDSGSGVGGSPGQFSGFDLDAIKLSTTFAATAAAASAAPGIDAFDFASTGALFRPGSQRAPADPKLFGTDGTGMRIDPDFATLDAFDGVFFQTGALTLGDGGSIIFNLTTPVPTEGLLLYVGELGTNGESLAATIEVSDASAPEPWAAALLGLALALLASLHVGTRSKAR